MTAAPYALTDAPGLRARLGLIILQTDETLELDLRRLFPGTDIGLHISRIPSAAVLTAESIAQMERDLPVAAALLPPLPEFGAVSYCCTSGTALIGADRVADLIRSKVNTKTVCNPLSAVIDACRALSISRIGLVSPYTEDIANGMKHGLRAAGFAVPKTFSFDEAVEANVARIDEEASFEAAMRVADGADAIFLSCTNLRTLDVIPRIEEASGLPVLSSNLCLAWSMAHGADVPDALPSGFRLTEAT